MASTVDLDAFRECVEALDVIDESDDSDGVSLSDAELSSRCSSGIDSTWKVCDAFIVRGRMIDHSGDSFIRSLH